MSRSVIGWLVWFLAVATLVLFLSAAEKFRKENSVSAPGRVHQEYRFYMD